MQGAAVGFFTVKQRVIWIDELLHSCVYPLVQKVVKEKMASRNGLYNLIKRGGVAFGEFLS